VTTAIHLRLDRSRAGGKLWGSGTGDEGTLKHSGAFWISPGRDNVPKVPTRDYQGSARSGSRIDRPGKNRKTSRERKNLNFGEKKIKRRKKYNMVMLRALRDFKIQGGREEGGKQDRKRESTPTGKERKRERKRMGTRT